MVIYKCLVCDIKWSKLFNDGCWKCSSPCQIIESNEEVQSTRGDTEDLSTLVEQNKIQFAHIAPQSSPEPSSQSTGGVILEKDDDLISTTEIRQDSDYEGQEDFEYDSALSALLYLDSSDVKSNSNVTNTGNIRPTNRAQLSSGSDQTTEVFDKYDADQRKQNTLTNFEKSSKKALESSVKDVGPLQGGTAAKKKKEKKKNLGNQRRTYLSTTSLKVLPQLEMPEPIPTPIPKGSEGQWNQVVRKGSAKAANKVQRNALKGVKEREIVNASSHLARNNENERLEWDRNSIAVRINMGAAKHDIRRVIPRSALE